MNRKFPFAALFLPLAMTATACGDDHDHDHDHDHEHEVVEHACIHATDGPFVDVTAAADDAADRPSVAVEHTGVRVALTETGGTPAYEGWVDFPADEEGHHAIFVNPDATLTVFDPNGTEVALEALDAEECGTLATGFELDAEVGTYTFMIGADEATVLFVIEHAGEEHDHE